MFVFTEKCFFTGLAFLSTFNAQRQILDILQGVCSLGVKFTRKHLG